MHCLDYGVAEGGPLIVGGVMTWLDRLGSMASGLCAVHCASMALLPAVGALVGGELNERFEWGFFSAAFTLAAVGAVAGYRAHGSAMVVTGFAVGLSLLSLGRAAEALALFEGGGVLAVVGGMVLVASHVRSLGCRRSCAKSACAAPGAA